jgi:hypothetical protein
MTSISLATEDPLSEAVGLKMISEICPTFQLSVVVRQGGNGYLRSRLRSFQEIARREHVLLITDLDSGHCPSDLIRLWLGRSPQPPKLLFRVAVREIESWLLADHDAMRLLVGVKATLPSRPDQLADPKYALLDIARHAPRDVRSDLRRERGSIASQGIGYNNRLIDLVRNHWCPRRASLMSPSLNRACARLADCHSASSGSPSGVQT